tara:strand:- start:857 stop:2407 length:1551 start_codon:yes stop_codon:yes gene_type:complete
MEYTENTIDKIKGKKILVVSFTAMTPHLETSLEVSRRLSKNNLIEYVHLGKHVTRPTMYSKLFIKRKIQMPIRVRRVRNYLEKYSNKQSKIKWIKTAKLSSINESRTVKYNFQTLKELQILKFKNYNIGVGVASTIITDLADPDPFPLEKKVLNEIKQQIKSAKISIDLAELILKNNTYDAIVLFNGRMTCEHAFKQVAKSKGVKIYFHERVKNNTRFFFEDYQPHIFDKRKEEMKQMKKEIPNKVINRIGEDFFKRKVKGDGVFELSYTKDQVTNTSEKLKTILQINNDKKIISYFTSSDDEYQSIDGVSSRYPFFKDQRSAVKDIADLASSLNYFLIVRVHPNLQTKSLEEINRWSELSVYIKKKGFHWVSQKDPESTYDIINKSSLIISAGSTVGVEAAYLGKKSIVITNCFYNGVIPSVVLAERKEDLRRCLCNSDINESIDPEDTYIYGVWIMNNGPQFQYYVPLHEYSVLYGLMKDGTRIANPGVFQWYIELIKYLLGIGFKNFENVGRL